MDGRHPFDHLIAALCFIVAPLYGFATRYHLARGRGRQARRAIREVVEVIAPLVLGSAQRPSARARCCI